MRLIDAETFPNKLKEMMIQIDKNRGEPEEDWFLYGFDEFVIALDVIDLVKEMPTIDAEPVVRCKDCKYCSVNRYADGNIYGYVCIETDCGVEADDFCSRGKRREDDETRD